MILPNVYFWGANNTNATPVDCFRQRSSAIQKTLDLRDSPPPSLCKNECYGYLKLPQNGGVFLEMANLANGERPIETAKENLGNTIWHQKRLMQKQNPWHALRVSSSCICSACLWNHRISRKTVRSWPRCKKTLHWKDVVDLLYSLQIWALPKPEIVSLIFFNQRTTCKMFTLQSHDFHRFYQVFVLSSQALIRDNNGKNHSMLLLMAEIWLTTWDVWNPINNGINHQPLNWWNRRIGPPSTVQLFNPFHHEHLSTKARTRCTSQTAAPCVGLCHGLTVMPLGLVKVISTVHFFSVLGRPQSRDLKKNMRWKGFNGEFL